MARPLSVDDDAGTAAPAGGHLQSLDIRPAGAEDAPGAFKAGMFFVGNAGNQIEPVLKTFHEGLLLVNCMDKQWCAFECRIAETCMDVQYSRNLFSAVGFGHLKA